MQMTSQPQHKTLAPQYWLQTCSITNWTETIANPENEICISTEIINQIDSNPAYTLQSPWMDNHSHWTKHQASKASCMTHVTFTPNIKIISTKATHKLIAPRTLTSAKHGQEKNFSILYKQLICSLLNYASPA